MKSASVKQAHLIACCSCQDSVPKTADSSRHVSTAHFLGFELLCSPGAPLSKDDKFQYPWCDEFLRLGHVCNTPSRKLVVDRACVSTLALGSADLGRRGLLDTKSSKQQ